MESRWKINAWNNHIAYAAEYQFSSIQSYTQRQFAQQVLLSISHLGQSSVRSILHWLPSPIIFIARALKSRFRLSAWNISTSIFKKKNFTPQISDMALKFYTFGPRNGVRPFHLAYQIQSANFWFTLGSSNASNSSRNATCTNVMLRRIIYWHLFFSYERNTRDGFMSWTQAEKFKAIQFARQAFQRKQLQNVLMLAPKIKIKKKLSFLKNFVFSSEIPKILLFPQRNFFAPSYYIFWHEEILCSSIGIKGSIIVCLFVCFCRTHCS